MGEALGAVLKAARKERGRKAREIGAHLGISPAAIYQWENGKTEPETPNLVKAAEYLGIDLAAAVEGRLVLVDAASPPDEPRARPDVTLPPPGQEQSVKLPPIGNRDVEVMGTAVGGEGADFRLNGETIDRIPRPPGIAHKRDVFAVYLENDSMYPALRHGDPLYIDPHRQARNGEDVLVELHGKDGEPGDAFAKRLVRRTPTKIVVEQFNPPKQIEFDAADVRQVLRIIPWQELISA